jgi:hypothetical protein
MAEKPLSRFPVPQLEEMPADIRDQLVAVQARTGFIPMCLSCWRIAPLSCGRLWPIIRH